MPVKSAELAKSVLETEFANELNEHQLEAIEVIKNLSIISFWAME